MIDSIDSPAAKNSRIVCTVIRLPLIVGLPLQISGSITIYSLTCITIYNAGYEICLFIFGDD